MYSTAYIALGANLGNCRDTFVRSVRTLTDRYPVTVTAGSKLYQTSAVGGPVDQPDYLNTTIAVRTHLCPHDLLTALLQIELGCGRERHGRSGPRTLDLDLLFYDDLIVQDKLVQLPHPRAHCRKFVLQPLSDIAPDLVHPQLGIAIKTLLLGLKNDERVCRRAGPEWLVDPIQSSSSSAPSSWPVVSPTFRQ